MDDAPSLRQIAQARAPFSAWLGILLLFALFGVIVLAVVGPSVRTDQYEQTRAKKRVEILKGLRDEDAKALNSYALIDQAKGSAHIPIDRAVQLTMAELAQKKPAPAYPIATPAPAAAPATQPGANATPQAAPAPASAQPAASPTARPNPSAPGTPLPVAGKSPTP